MLSFIVCICVLESINELPLILSSFIPMFGALVQLCPPLSLNILLLLLMISSVCDLALFIEKSF